jgi:Tfp pilus assembly PilM family ATPase
LKINLADFKKILHLSSGTGLSGIFAGRPSSLLVVDLSSELKIVSVQVKPEVKITALKIAAIPEKGRDEAILGTLQDFLKGHPGHPQQVLLCPQPGSLFIRRLQITAVPDKELDQAVKWKLKEELPFDISRAIFGYAVINKSGRADGSAGLDIQCVAAEEEEISRQAAILKQAGLEPLAAVPAVLGYSDFIRKYLAEESQGLTGMVSLLEEKSYFMIFDHGKFGFHRELPVSLRKLKDALSTVLFSDKGKVQLSPEEIEDVLFHYGMPDSEFSYKDKISSSQITAMLRPVFEQLAQEIARSLAYYQSQFHGGKIEKVLLAGDAIIPHLDKFLNQETAAGILFSSLSGNISYAEEVNPADISRSLAAVGLASAYPSGVNLMPLEFRSGKIEAAQRLFFRWLGIGAFLFLLVSYVFGRALIGVNQQRLNNAEINLGVLSDIKKTKDRLEAINAFTSSVRSSEFSAGMLLYKLSLSTPPEIFLDNFSLNADAKTGTIRGIIKGSDVAQETIVAKFVSAIEGTGYFKDVAVVSVGSSSAQDTSEAAFNISFILK